MLFKKNNNKLKKSLRIFRTIIWKKSSQRWRKCKMRIIKKMPSLKNYNNKFSKCNHSRKNLNKKSSHLHKENKIAHSLKEMLMNNRLCQQ